MEENRRDTQAPEKRKPNLLVRLLAFLVTLALVLGAVALVVNRDRLNLDAVKRYFSYRDLERSDSGQAQSFRVDGGDSSRYASVDGDLLLCFTKGVKLYSGSGTVYVEDTIVLENPVVDAAGKTALVYDAGGQELRVYAGRAEVFSLTLEENRSLLSARVNENGWLAVTAQESGYKGAVTVYNGSYTPVMQVSLSSRFIMDAVLAPDNSALAVLTIGVGEREFESRIDFYRLDRKEESDQPDASCSIGNNAVLDLRWSSDGVWALGESAVSLATADGSLTGTCDYGGRYLKGFSLGGNGTAALLLGKYRAGSSAELVVTDEAGQARASLPLEEQVLSLSAAGRYVAVLTADRLDIYDQDLNLYSTLSGTQGARQVLQRSDGSAMLIGDGAAQLYVPQ